MITDRPNGESATRSNEGGQTAGAPGVHHGEGRPGPYGGWGAGGRQGPPQPPGTPYVPGGAAGPGAPRGWSLRRKVAAVGAVLAIALGAGGTGAAVAVGLTARHDGLGDPAAVSGVTNRSTLAQVAAAVQPSVVAIQTTTRSGSGGGSGVILRADGTIITNAHVVEDVSDITVRFSDGRRAPAAVVGTDPERDIAVIKASGVSGLKAAALGDSRDLAVGDTVLAVGSPLGLDGSVTSGIVSALGRQIQEGGRNPGPDLPPGFGDRLSPRQSTVIRNAIQTDAAINPGNSGGALVNAAGQVIGINTAIATGGQGAGSIGVGFAIPINDARKAAASILATAGR